MCSTASGEEGIIGYGRRCFGGRAASARPVSASANTGGRCDKHIPPQPWPTRHCHRRTIANHPTTDEVETKSETRTAVSCSSYSRGELFI